MLLSIEFSDSHVSLLQGSREDVLEKFSTFFTPTEIVQQKIDSGLNIHFVSSTDKVEKNLDLATQINLNQVN